MSESASVTNSLSESSSISQTSSSSISISASLSPSLSASLSPSLSASLSPSLSASLSPSLSASPSVSLSATQTISQIMPSFPYASPSTTAFTLIPNAPSMSAEGIGIICGVAASVIFLCILSCLLRRRFLCTSKPRYYQKRRLNKKVKSIVTMLPQATAVPIQYTHAPRMPANTKLINFSDSQYGV
jgi:hypothetical protein